MAAGSPLGTAGKTDWVARTRRLSRPRAAAAIACTLLVSWAASILLGGAGRIPPHWFYIPILLTAARFGLVGTVLTALVAGVVAGPLLPLDIAQGTAQASSDWIGRTGFFIGNGIIMALVIGQLRSLLDRELEVADAGRELARHKEAVIQTVSHEFRTPLTVIRGTTDFLTEAGVVSEEARPLVENLEIATRRLENLIRLVLAAAGALSPLDRSDAPLVVRELCEGISAAFDEPTQFARVRLDIATDAEIVVCDRELLSLALHALIENALRFSPQSSPVEVTVHRLADAVKIRVRDRGPGIGSDELRRLMEPFTQHDESISRRRQGLGLGLFAVQKTVELLNGAMDLRSLKTGGTEATLTIPQPMRA